MKKMIKVGTLGVMLVFGMMMAGCDNGNTDIPDTDKIITYECVDSALGYIRLVVTGSGAYTPQTGDRYVLYQGIETINSGTVTVDGDELICQPSNGGVSFSVSISGTGIAAVTGSVKSDDGASLSISPSPGKAFVFKDVPDGYTSGTLCLITSLSWKSDEVDVVAIGDYTDMKGYSPAVFKTAAKTGNGDDSVWTKTATDWTVDGSYYLVAWSPTVADIRFANPPLIYTLDKIDFSPKMLIKPMKEFKSFPLDDITPYKNATTYQSDILDGYSAANWVKVAALIDEKPRYEFTVPTYAPLNGTWTLLEGASEPWVGRNKFNIRIIILAIDAQAGQYGKWKINYLDGVRNIDWFVWKIDGTTRQLMFNEIVE
jgi:hypothetical protein